MLIRATMKDGTKAIERTIVQIDNTAPTIRLIAPGKGGSYNQVLDVSGLSKDDVALRDVVAMCLPPDMEATIKWPNDIYVGDKKLAGILIENQLAEGKIAQTIVGVGLNVNQEKWEGNAPNPTSLRLLTQQTWEIEPLLQAFLRNLSEEMQNLRAVKERYLQHLYRRKGWYFYEEREVSTQPTMNQASVTAASFEAEFADVTPQGELCLRLRNGEEKQYHFKQIRFIIV